MQGDPRSTVLRRQPQQALTRIGVGLALALAGAALDGCADKKADVGAPPCPSVAVLADAAHLVVFRDGGGRDLTDVRYEAQLGPITGECIYRKKNTNVTVEMKLRIVAKLGPAAALTDRGVDLGYFVAVVDQQSKVLARKVFQTQLQFPPNQAEMGTLDELEEIINLKQDQPGSDFNVIVGFLLDKEQVDRNRAARGGT
jgi:hypothetical protein